MDKRIDKNQKSITSLKDLLRDITVNSGHYLNDQDTIIALKSQGALAKFSDEVLGIYPSSINTQKRIADAFLEGGYETLNQLRIAAQLALENRHYQNKRPDKETKAGLLLTIANLESENQSLKQELLLLTLAFEKTLQQGLRYANHANETIKALCKKEQREILDMLTLRRHPINSNVIKLDEG